MGKNMFPSFLLRGLMHQVAFPRPHRRFAFPPGERENSLGRGEALKALKVDKTRRIRQQRFRAAASSK